MTVKVAIGRSINPELFQMFVYCLESIRQEYNVSARWEISNKVKELYRVDIGPLRKLEDGTNVHYAEFESEQDYTLFLLRWS